MHISFTCLSEIIQLRLSSSLVAYNEQNLYKSLFNNCIDVLLKAQTIPCTHSLQELAKCSWCWPQVPKAYNEQSLYRSLSNNGVGDLLQTQSIPCTHSLQELAKCSWGRPQVPKHTMNKTYTGACPTTVLKPFSRPRAHHIHNEQNL